MNTSSLCIIYLPICTKNKSFVFFLLLVANLTLTRLYMKKSLLYRKPYSRVWHQQSLKTNTCQCGWHHTCFFLFFFHRTHFDTLIKQKNKWKMNMPVFPESRGVQVRNLTTVFPAAKDVANFRTFMLVA